MNNFKAAGGIAILVDLKGRRILVGGGDEPAAYPLKPSGSLLVAYFEWGGRGFEYVYDTAAKQQTPHCLTEHKDIRTPYVSTTSPAPRQPADQPRKGFRVRKGAALVRRPHELRRSKNLPREY